MKFYKSIIPNNTKLITKLLRHFINCHCKKYNYIIIGKEEREDIIQDLWVRVMLSVNKKDTINSEYIKKITNSYLIDRLNREKELNDNLDRRKSVEDINVPSYIISNFSLEIHYLLESIINPEEKLLLISLVGLEGVEPYCSEILSKIDPKLTKRQIMAKICNKKQTSPSFYNLKKSIKKKLECIIKEDKI